MKTKLLRTLRDLGKAGFILTVTFCAVVFCGCAGEIVDTTVPARESDPEEGGTMHELGTFEGLPAETERRILQDCFDAFIKTNPAYAGVTVSNIFVSKYYGTHNGWIVVNVKDGQSHPQVGGYQVIEGFRFWKNVGEIILVWKDGQFYTSLLEVYNAGLWTLDDLKNLANYF